MANYQYLILGHALHPLISNFKIKNKFTRNFFELDSPNKLKFFLFNS